MAGFLGGMSSRSDSMPPERGRGHTWRHLVKKGEIFYKSLGFRFYE